METARLPLPAVVAAQQGLAEPRYPSVRDVMRARRRGAEVRPVADFAAASKPTTVTVVSRELKSAAAAAASSRARRLWPWPRRCAFWPRRRRFSSSPLIRFQRSRRI